MQTPLFRAVSRINSARTTTYHATLTDAKAYLDRELTAAEAMSHELIFGVVHVMPEQDHFLPVCFYYPQTNWTYMEFDGELTPTAC